MAHILMLTPQSPYPPEQGTSLRNFHILRALARNHQVTLLFFDEPDRAQTLDPLRALCRVLPPIPIPSRPGRQRLRQLLTTRMPDLALRLHSETFTDALRTALTADAYDAVQIEGIELAVYIPLVRTHAPGARVVLDCHNAETELQRRALAADRRQPRRWPAAVYSAAQIGRLARFERWALEAADTVLAVSETDRAKLRDLLAPVDEAITVVPNSIDVEQYHWRDPVPPELCFDLVFTGKMDYRPNVDGVLWFAETIWPLVRQARPAATWVIVGRRPHARLDSLRRMPGVTLTGRVPDVQPYLAGASIYIVPLRIGSGTRLKLIEAMAAGKCIVSTRLGAEGFDVESDRELVLAERPEEWATAILELLGDAARRAKLGIAAQEFAAQFDWRHIIPLLNTIYPPDGRQAGGE